MDPERSDFATLVAAVADGRFGDVIDALSSCNDEDERRLIEQLQILSRVAAVGHLDEQDWDPAAPSAVRSSTDFRATVAPEFIWGPLNVCAEIGRGAFGRVFRARDPRLDRDVALKLFDRTTGDPTEFLREARLLARVRHPHVVVVYGADVVDGRAGLWMELIDGRSLRTVVEEQGPYSARETTLIGIELCAAVAAVHSAGLSHGDIKPSNVLRERGGRVVLMDFGAARFSVIDAATNARPSGTPLYMAPELFEGNESSVLTDVYALGVLLFFLVTGEHPVIAPTLGELRRKHHHATRRSLRDLRPEVPATFAQIVERCLSPDPSARFRTATELEQALSATPEPRTATSFVSSTSKSALYRLLNRPVPLWTTVLSFVFAAVIAIPVSNWVTSFSAVRNDGADAANAPPGRRALSSDVWKKLAEYEALAVASAARRDWVSAAGRYNDMSGLLLSQGWQDEPYRAHVIAKMAWMQVVAGQSATGRENLALAMYKLAQEAGAEHPLRATIEMALATERHAVGDLAEAALAVRRAIELREGALSIAGVRGFSPSVLDMKVLAAALRKYSPSEDSDNDWIPNAIEIAAGLNPFNADSDGDGILDDEESSGVQGLSNGLRWSIVPDPTMVLAHFGTLDPERAGFRRERQFQGAVAPHTQGFGPGWRVAATMGFYYQQLHRPQQSAAALRGWRLLSIGALRTGLGYVSLDFGPEGSRFDQHFAIRDGRMRLQAVDSVVPRGGELHDLGPLGRWGYVEYVSSPPSSGTRVVIQGTRRQNNFLGHRQFQEGFGFFFGSADDVESSARGVGQADFSLLLLQIR